MTLRDLDDVPIRRDAEAPAGHGGHPGHRGHGLMMIICCVPMLLVAGVLVATGLASARVLLAAVGCAVMMAAMMAMMGMATGKGHGNGGEHHR